MTKRKIALVSTEDAAVLVAATLTDVCSDLKGLSNNRTAIFWHHQAGVDVTGAGYTVTSEVALIAETAHGLSVGDPVTFSASSGASINGVRTVATVPDANSYTVAAAGVADEAGPVTVTYFAKYTYPEAAWGGLMLPTVPGSATWAYKTLAGITPAPTSALNSTQEAAAKGKNANLYTTIGGLGQTHNGIMASGRFIDIQRGIDWLQARMEERIYSRLANSEKVPFTQAGFGIIEGEIRTQMQEGVDNGLLGPLLDSDSGEFFRVTVPRASAVSDADRALRALNGITVEAQIAGAIHTISMTINVKV